MPDRRVVQPFKADLHCHSCVSDGVMKPAELAARAQQQLAAGQDPAVVVEQLAHALTNRLLHVPTAVLRDAAARGNLELLRAFEPLLPPATPDDDDDAADPAP